MKLPKKRRARQLSLAFDKEVQTFTVCTSTIGDFFEEATLRLFGGIRFTTESHMEYCPDVQVSKKLYLESKASGRSNRVILYRGRLERELKWCEENKCSIEYVIWSHHCVTKECENGQQLLDSLAETTGFVVRIPIRIMKEEADKIKVKCINRWNQSGYTHGWLIPLKTLLSRCNVEAKRKLLRVDNQLIRNFTIHTYADTAIRSPEDARTHLDAVESPESR